MRTRYEVSRRGNVIMRNRDTGKFMSRKDYDATAGKLVAQRKTIAMAESELDTLWERLVAANEAAADANSLAYDLYNQYNDARMKLDHRKAALKEAFKNE